ncbi:uncharacterized protein N7515_006379 [Penicillium bovifimosum]|uniref:Uncharacterized protein n=1 Tax=Penicillium bovifimosum TaxID=126998 RepID=A0A9W9L115_9EURO|nr:uncharacterized protein N7515_006379 [Penicillium bovifimosum]KAJ5130340.1 hypothetical protein N7515_006379 [Penicillium bovifimosum]
MATSTPSETLRPITSKRRHLIPPHKPTSPKVSKVLNPSASPPETRIKPSHDEIAENRRKTSSTEHEAEKDYEPSRFEISFSMPPQPFLDPPIWEASLNRARERLAQRPLNEIPAAGVGESAERRRQRLEQELEYGSMAIRGRSSVSGRGRRGRGAQGGTGNVYWGGRR